MKHHLGVCSWSLQPESPAGLAERVLACELSGVQLALDPLAARHWAPGGTVSALERAGVRVLSGMWAPHGEDYSTLESIAETGGVRVDRLWAKNLESAEVCARTAGELGIGLVTFHAGFLPEDDADGERSKLLGRLRQVADVFADHGVKLGLETGQETAENLLGVLAELDRESVGVNFDPANMVLYGMGEPVAALEALAEHVVQIHIKDATPTETPGTWGAEVPAGTGAVDWTRFFDVVRDRGLEVNLLIEREAGDDRVGDVRIAKGLVRAEVERIGGSVS